MMRFKEGQLVRLNRSYSGEGKGRIAVVKEVAGWYTYRVDYRDALGRKTMRYINEDEAHRVSVIWYVVVIWHEARERLKSKKKSII